MFLVTKEFSVQMNTLCCKTFAEKSNRNVVIDAIQNPFQQIAFD